MGGDRSSAVRALVIGGVSVAMVFASAVARAECTKDVDCKGDRVCENGRCVSPPPAAATPPVVAPVTSAPPAPSNDAPPASSPPSMAPTTTPTTEPPGTTQPMTAQPEVVPAPPPAPTEPTPEPAPSVPVVVAASPAASAKATTSSSPRGLRPTFDIRLQALLLSDSPKGHFGSTFGGGGGLSLRGGGMTILGDGGNVWVGPRFGGGVDINLLEVSPAGTSKVHGGALLAVPIYAGMQLGLGSRDQGRWKGAVLGVDWQPSLLWASLKGASATGSALAAFQLTCDYATVEDDKGGFHFRAALWIIPPVSDLPLFAGIGAGTSFY